MVDYRDEQVEMATISSFVDGCVKGVGYGTVEADFGIFPEVL
jgi:Na+-transporting NADH:ubiquinone oxidoreductase subunit NqrD